MSDRLKVIYKELLQRTNGGEQLASVDANHVAAHIDACNSLPFPVSAPAAKDLTKICVLLCQVLSPSHELLASKVCLLVTNVVTKQESVLEQSHLDSVLAFFAALLRASKGWLVVDGLRTLAVVLFENGSRCEEQFDELLSILIPLAHPSSMDRESRRMAINCLGNMCVKAGAVLETHPERQSSIFDVLYLALCSERASYGELSFSKMLCSALRALQFVVLESKEVHISKLAELLAHLKALLFYGRRVSFGRRQPGGGAGTPEEGIDGEFSADDGDSEDDGGTSDSDQAEDGNSTSFRGSKARVRLNSLIALQSVARCSGRDMYAHWHLFIPDSPKPMTSSLFDVILGDPSSKVRGAAAYFMMLMLDHSRAHLAIADDFFRRPENLKKRRPAYISLSQTLGDMIHELHKGLLEALTKETHAAALAQMVKALAALVANTPYERLSPGVVSSVITGSLALLHVAEDLGLKAASLSCLAAVFNLRTCLPEIRQSVCSIDPWDFSSRAFAIVTAPRTPSEPRRTGSCPVIMYLLDLAMPRANPRAHRSQMQSEVAVRTEAIHVLSCIPRVIGNDFRMHWRELSAPSLHLLKDKEPSVRLQASKLLEETVGVCAAQSEDGAPGAPVDELAELWRELLATHIPVGLADAGGGVIASVLACLAHLPPEVFAKLEIHDRELCINSALEKSGPSAITSTSVQGAALRTLGVFALFPQLCGDVEFSKKVVDKISSAVLMPGGGGHPSNGGGGRTKGSGGRGARGRGGARGRSRGRGRGAERAVAATIRARGAWALGNLCDALARYLDERGLVDAPGLEDLLPDVVALSLTCAKDNDKVKSNAMRALGHLARVLPPTLQHGTVSSGIEEVVAVLVATALGASVKVRWNACYALGNFLRNQCLSELCLTKVECLASVHEALCVVLSECANFKIRKNAALAMAIPPVRENYADSYVEVLRAVVLSLQTIDKESDSSEYQYKAALQQQLVSTLAHLIMMCTTEDFANARSFFLENVDVLLAAFEGPPTSKFDEQLALQLSPGGKALPTDSPSLPEVVAEPEHPHAGALHCVAMLYASELQDLPLQTVSRLHKARREVKQGVKRTPDNRTPGTT